jgi:hypothetical protein
MTPTKTFCAFATGLTVLAVALHGCGRTEIDDGFALIDVTSGGAGSGTTGTSTSATGGQGGATTAPGGHGGAAAVPRAAPIPCGTTSCTPGAQICCVQESRRGNSETCLAAAAVCQGGASVGCLDSSSCGSGQVCCESLLASSTECAAADACLQMPGVILCRAAADCPSVAPHCCPTENGGICAAQACPAGGAGDFGGPPGAG